MSRSMQAKAKKLDEEIIELVARRETLESEVLLLEGRIADSDSGKIVDSGLYEFDEGDKTAVAFDEFYGDVDPKLEKIRNDLLNDSSRRRRFSLLPVRLGG